MSRWRPGQGTLTSGQFGGSGALSGSARFANVTITGQLRIANNTVLLDSGGVSIIGNSFSTTTPALNFRNAVGDLRSKAGLIGLNTSGDPYILTMGVNYSGEGAFLAVHGGTVSGAGKARLDIWSASGWTGSYFEFTNTDCTIKHIADATKPVTLTRGRGSFPDGIVTLVKAGVPADGDFGATPASGLIAVDSTNSRIYVRVGTTWKYAALT